MKDEKILNKIVLTAALAVLFFTAVTAVAGATTIYVPEGGNQTIQQAVNNATAGDTIIVRDGTYHENVVVNKSVTIRSDNGSANCIVNASNSGDHVFNVSADYVNVSGFTVENATGSWKAGIYLYGRQHCNISDNNVTNNYFGIYLSSSSNNNTLTSNTANYNIHYGIFLYSSSHNTLTNNTANNNNFGIYLYFSSNNNALTNNTANSNGYGIYLQSSSNYNTLTTNTANNNTFGIYLYSSSNYNILTNNTANSNNYYGIHLYSYSNYNTLTTNTANNNTFGIYLNSASNNNIYNNYFNNTNNAWDNGNNVWNTTKTAGTNIIGGSWLGGNYWSDYAGKDTNGDGLGDTLLPYTSSGNIMRGGDWHPLVQVGAPPTPVPVPEFNAIGLLALIGILSVVLAVAMLRKS